MNASLLVDCMFYLHCCNCSRYGRPSIGGTNIRWTILLDVYVFVEEMAMFSMLDRRVYGLNRHRLPLALN